MSRIKDKIGIVNLKISEIIELRRILIATKLCLY